MYKGGSTTIGKRPRSVFAERAFDAQTMISVSSKKGAARAHTQYKMVTNFGKAAQNGAFNKL